jgi:hypothetical protein
MQILLSFAVVKITISKNPLTQRLKVILHEFDKAQYYPDKNFRCFLRLYGNYGPATVDEYRFHHKDLVV